MGNLYLILFSHNLQPSTNHNCYMCKQDENGNYIYHFIYNQPGQCITEQEKPDNTYQICFKIKEKLIK